MGGLNSTLGLLAECSSNSSGGALLLLLLLVQCRTASACSYQKHALKTPAS
jgi:hypothetical protein